DIIFRLVYLDLRGVDVGRGGAALLAGLDHLCQRLRQSSAAGVGCERFLADDRGLGWDAKAEGPHPHHQLLHLSPMESSGLVVYVRKIIGTCDLFLLLAVDYRKLRHLEASVLFEGEIDGL